MKRKISIDINTFNDVYEMNKKLDAVFLQKYNHPEFIKKNKLELLVEIGELANESRCFKYWSKKKIDHDLVGFELADCFIMTLCFFNNLNIDLNEEYFYDIALNDVVDSFFSIYDLTINFVKTDSPEVLKKIFVSLIYLGKNLGFNIDEMVDYCKMKIEKDLERLSG